MSGYDAPKPCKPKTLQTCNTCGKQFSNRSSYRKHQTVHQPRQHLCNECGKLFKDSNALKRHIGVVHMGDLPFTCPHCPRRFIARSALVQHIRIHTGERPHLCMQCGRAFRTSTSLRIHEMRHRGERPHKCNKCDRRFATTSNLRGHHQKVHDCNSQRRPRRVFRTMAGITEALQCEVPGCTEELSTARAFDRHVFEHYHPYLCPFCPQGYMLEKSRDIHVLRQHSTDGTPGEYKCPVCNACYEMLCDLLEHEAEHKFKDRQYTCIECQLTFGSEYKFMKHVDRNHKHRPWTCNLCDKTFMQYSGLYIHKKTHSGVRKYSCPHCNRSFLQQQKLKIHLRVHTGEKPHICPICSKGFALNCNLTVHIRRHTGERPFTCDECGKAFYDSSHMRKHQRSQHPYKTE